jgi:hypothetical protein
MKIFVLDIDEIESENIAEHITSTLESDKNIQIRTMLPSNAFSIDDDFESILFIVDWKMPQAQFNGDDLIEQLYVDGKTPSYIIYSGELDPGRRNELYEKYNNFIWWYQKEQGIVMIIEGINACLQKGQIKREYFPKSSITEAFSSLKHRIAHLFLSMDVDLQGIGVLRRQMAEDEIQNAVNTPKAYLRDVLNNKEKAYYRQRLADLQFLVAKVSVGGEEPFLECDGEPSGGPVMPTLSESNLPDDKAIVDLIPEEKTNNDGVVRLWSSLIDLSGLKPQDSDKPFENINPDTNSEIFEFMCLMDCKIEKKKNIREEDVNHVVDFFAKIKGRKGWTVKGANPSPIKCFNDWFCALDDCLEKLRKVIKPD